jgi:hypothetical protein
MVVHSDAVMAADAADAVPASMVKEHEDTLA